MRTAIKRIATALCAVLLMAGTLTAAEAVQVRIVSFSPTGGPPGTSVTLTGSGFTGATSVEFHGTAAVFATNLETQITTSVPVGATTGRIKVTTPAGSDVSSTNFRVTGASTPPTISSFSPSSGPVGTSVTINGTNLSTTTTVKFHGSAAAFTVNSDSTVTATVPAGATTGPISVWTPDGRDYSNTNFRVTGVVTPPTISSFSPASGPVGTSVDILGSGFTEATAVTFGAVSATFTILRGAKITATVPVGATTGRIKVAAPSGTATSSSNFRVTPGGAPHISGFSPSSGPVGTSVTINGTDFSATTAVKFHGSAAMFTVNSAIKITATVPTGATTGPISVWAPAGTDYSSTNFRVAGPKISSFAPVSGPPGTSVSIFGSGFTGATAVSFDGSGATYRVVRDGKITAVVPLGATSGLIRVVAPGGTAASASAFTVLASSHRRRVTLRLSRHLRVSGHIGVPDGYTACRAHMPVTVRRYHHGKWRLVASTSTGQDGSYRASLPDRPGIYQARIRRRTLPSGVTCGADLSRRHPHGV